MKINDLKISVLKIIRERVSRRTYVNRAVEVEKIEKLNQYLNGLSEGPFGGKARFEIIEYDAIDKQKVGNYGVLKGAGLFFGGVIKKASRCYEDFGYLFEKAILFASGLGLGTCWLGLTYDKSLFADKLRLNNDEVNPAVSPIGYFAEKPRFKDKIIRLAIRAKHRMAWDKLFFDNDFSTPLRLNNSNIGEYAECLEMVRLAPSGANRQSWRIVSRIKEYSRVFHFFVCYSSKEKYLHKIDIGIAMSHFELTAKELELNGSWKVLDEPIVQPLPANTEYIVSWIDSN